MKRQRRDGGLLRGFIQLATGQLLSKVVGLVAFAYLARTLGPQAYGAVEVATAMAMFCAIFVEFGFGPVGVRELTRDPQRVDVLAATIPAARTLIALPIIPIMGLVAILMDYPVPTVRLVWLFAVSLFAAPWSQKWLLQGHGMMGRVAAGQVIRMVTFAAGAIVFVHGPHDLLAVGYVEIAAVAMAAMFYLGIQHFCITPVRLRFFGSEIRHLAGQSFAIGLSYVVWAANNFVPVILVSTAGTAQTAWFGAAHRIVISLAVFSNIYHFNLFPTIAERAAQSAGAVAEVLHASFRVIAWTGGLLGLSLVLLAEPLLVLAFGREFTSSVPSFVILIWMVPVTLLSGHARWLLVASGKQQYVLYAQLAGFATMLTTGLILIRFFEAVGGAIAVLAANLVVWSVAHVYATAGEHRLPFLGVLIRPALLVLALTALSRVLGLSPWVATALSATTYIALAPLLDGKLMADLKRLM